MMVRDVPAAIGRRMRTFNVWRLEDRDFGRRITALRLRNKDTNQMSGMDFVEFRQLYFERPTAPHHYRMVEAIERAEPDTLTMILAYPNAAKTSVVADRINYVLALNPDYRVCVISEGQDLAVKIMGQVANRMTDEHLFLPYIERYGPFRSKERNTSKPWNTERISVLLSHNDEKEPSMEAKGWGSRLYGGRYDWMVFDDLQSSESLNQTTQILRYMRQTALTRVTRGEGRSLAVGSRVGPGDIWEVMDDEGMVSNTVVIPALTEWVDKEDHFWVDSNRRVHLVEGCPEVSSWPLWWSMLEFANRRRMVGEEVWARTYMQKQVTSAGAAFTDDILEDSKDRERKQGKASVGVDIIMSVDPAFDSGICAFGVAAYSNNRLWVLETLERRDIYRYEDIYGQIGQWAIRYRPSTVIVEQNNFQKGLHQDDRMEALARKFGFALLPHQTSRNKHDPVIGVKMMASAFVDREISIPWGDDDAISCSGRLLDELRQWRPKTRSTQDLVIVLWMMWLYWENQRQNMGIVLPAQFVPAWAKSGGAPRWAMSG
jgi:hypothetical protein